MPLYEYRCTSCGDQIVTDCRLEDSEDIQFLGHDSHGRPSDPGAPDIACAAGLKRTWSVGFQIKSGNWGHD